MNVLDYIKSQMDVWGEDYVYDLMERGYTPILTNKGWKWIHNSSIVVNPFNQPDVANTATNTTA